MSPNSSLVSEVAISTCPSCWSPGHDESVIAVDAENIADCAAGDARIADHEVAHDDFRRLLGGLASVTPETAEQLEAENDADGAHGVRDAIGNHGLVRCQACFLGRCAPPHGRFTNGIAGGGERGRAGERSAEEAGGARARDRQQVRETERQQRPKTSTPTANILSRNPLRRNASASAGPDCMPMV